MKRQTKLNELKNVRVKKVNIKKVMSQQGSNSELGSELQKPGSQVKQKMETSSRLRQVIRNKISNHREDSESDVKLGNIVSSISRSMKRTITHSFECQICMQTCKEVPNLYVAKCIHRLSYCESCMHEYAIYMVNQFQEVSCPNSQCDILIDTEGKFFRELPLEVQKKYIKLHNFQLTLKDSSLKLCPSENCDGVIKLEAQESTAMTCNLCAQRFCVKCLMKAHPGTCDDFQAAFLVKNLKYKRCRRCNMVIQKNQGCNHITCKCGHQFCYVCGADWSPSHYQDHAQQDGMLIQPHIPNIQAQVQQDQGCCYQTWRIIAIILISILIKIPVTILLLVLLLIAVLLAPTACQCLVLTIAAVWQGGLWQIFCE